MSLREIISDEIHRHGAIPFSRFMELCLYHSELGYYSAERERFGRGGDFYTASDIHAIYGRLMARQFDEMWRTLRKPALLRIIELGPGRGLFAQDVLAWTEKKFPDFCEALRYSLVESSPSLSKNLEQRFQAELQQGRVMLHRSLAELPPEETAIVFANEFFDAIPVEVLSGKGQLYIAIEKANQFGETWRTPGKTEQEFLNRLAVQPGPDDRIEVAPQLNGVMEKIGEKIKRGFCVVVDYGYTQSELEAGLHHDTLRAFRAHTLRTNVLDSPGEQDITADVNFTAIAELARERGFETTRLLRQSQFLIGIGEETQFAEVFDNCRLPQEHAKRALQLKHLITPEGLGEAFKVLVLFKGVPRDHVMALSGMRFAT